MTKTFRDLPNQAAVLLDANVVISALTPQSRFHGSCARLLERGARRELALHLAIHVAAEIIHRALDRPHPQDELREFDTKWRTTMADYLRPPNADLQFLLPLVFANKQMAERLAGAFLAAGLADELIVYIAPHLLGQGALPAFELPAIARMADRLDLTPLDVLSFGPDLRLRLRPAARA